MEFLSDRWIAELDRAASTSTAARALPHGLDLVIQELVTDDARGEVAYHLVLRHGEVAVRPGRASSPSVTLTQDRATAEAIARGLLSAQSAFMSGRLKLTGDATTLVENREALAGLGDVFAAVREKTTW